MLVPAAAGLYTEVLRSYLVLDALEARLHLLASALVLPLSATIKVEGERVNVATNGYLLRNWQCENQGALPRN